MRLTDPHARSAPARRPTAAAPRATRNQRSRGSDAGAVAVEFALIMPILMLFLFGVVQYGYGLFQMQAFSAALNEASRSASTGVADCTAFSTLVGSAMDENGITPGDLGGARMEWLDGGNDVTATPQRLGQVRVTATFRPFDIGIPLLPFPRTITRSSTASIQSVLATGLTGCALPDVGGG